MDGPVIRITNRLWLPEEELSFTASRSSGPGGQHVNKASTRVTLLFDVAHSPSLTPDQAARISRRLANRIGRDGVLRVSAQQHRTQTANRHAALERFVSLLEEALAEQAPRLDTRVPRRQRERRLAEKRHRARLKRTRAERRRLSESDE